MAIFEVEHDGEIYEVDAPDEAAAAGAFAPQQPAFDEAGASDAYKSGLQELSAQTQNPTLEKFRDMSPLARAGTSLYDSANLLAEGLTHGYGDKIAGNVRAWALGTDPEEEKAKLRTNTEASRQRSQGAGAALELTGNIAGPMKAFKAAGAGLGLASQVPGAVGTAARVASAVPKAVAAVPGLTGTGLRTAAAVGSGTGMGLFDAYGHDQDLSTGAVAGALGGLGGKALGELGTRTVGKIAGAFNKAPPKITKDMLENDAKQGFQEATDAGVWYNDAGIDRLKTKIKDELLELNYRKGNEPGVAAVIEDLRKVGPGTGQALTYGGLHSLRRLAQNGWIAGNASNNLALSKIIKRIDQLGDSADPRYIMMGNGPQAAAAGKRARKLWRQAKQVGQLEDLTQKGFRVGSRMKNTDVPGATRRQLQTILDNKRAGRGWTKEQKKLIEKATAYTPAQRIAHIMTALAPSDKLSSMMHLGAMGTTGALSGGTSLPLHLAGMAVGYGAKKVNEKISEKAFNSLIDNIARDGPAPVVENALQRLSKSQRDKVIRALTMGGASLVPQSQ